jgi:hypothetical protein
MGVPRPFFTLQMPVRVMAMTMTFIESYPECMGILGVIWVETIVSYMVDESA